MHHAITSSLCAIIWITGAISPAFVTTARGQVDTGALTAEEMLIQGTRAFNESRFADAESLFSGFLTEYGEEEEARKALPQMLPMLAMSRIQLLQLENALPVIEQFLKIESRPPPAVDEELRFWHAVCLMQADRQEESQEAFLDFASRFPDSVKRDEAILLAATSAIIQGKQADAAAFLARNHGELGPVARGRAAVLQLHALMETDAFDEALTLVMRELPDCGEMIQIVSFQTLAMQLGAHFLESGDHRKAIAALQRIWSRERLLRHQEDRLSGQQARLVAAKETGADPAVIFELSQIVSKVEREVGQFKEIEMFDSALRLRLASAFLGMERFREAALILEAMLAEMEPDPVVESASVTLAQCWFELESWTQVDATAVLFEEAFPGSDRVPLVRFMRGQALQNDGRLEESLEVLDSIATDFPNSDITPRAFFVAGFGQLLAEEHEDAIRRFAEFPRKFKGDRLEDDVFYWMGMAYSLAGAHGQSRDHMAEYLKKFPAGNHVGAANFRRAYSAHSLQDYASSIPEFHAFLEEFPMHPQFSEATILLGDGLMAIGEIEEGIAALRRTQPDDVRFFEEAWFKIGKAYRLLEEPERLRQHLAEFIRDHPESPRLPEAVYWIGWSHRQNGEEEMAIAAYWDAIREFGPDPARTAVEDLFSGLVRLYPGEDGKAQYLNDLRAMRNEAEANGQPVLAMRTAWAQGDLFKRTDPDRARQFYIIASQYPEPHSTSPLLLADLGDAQREIGEAARAARFYDALIKWNPRAPQKDRAFAGLGLLALDAGDADEALRLFSRFERETFGSPLFGTILVAKAEIEKKAGDFEAAQATLERLLAAEGVGSRDKAEALLQLGELFMAQNKPSLAIPYFQRVYVMYGRWSETVAKAYLRSGEAFEQLSEFEKAVLTYQEMLARDELDGFAETTRASERLSQLSPEDAA